MNVKGQSQGLVISTAPFVHEGTTTPKIMFEVLAAALLVLAFAVWNFGIGALFVVGAATAGAMGTEWATTRGRAVSPLRDYSAALTGVLMGLTLPPGFPLWMAFLGGIVGIGLGKLIWGGLGQNIFNPALVGRAFLQSAFPTAITTWAAPVKGDVLSIPGSQFAAPFMHGAVDVVSSATPLGLAKFDHQVTGVLDVFLGQVGGSLGETSTLVLLLAGLFLASRRAFDWRLPVSTVLAVAIFSGILFAVDQEAYPNPLFMVCSGGLLFAAVFMVTDPVSTPTTPRGAWVFGFGVGFLVVLIRIFGGLPEGVMYSVLLMNALTPHINRFTQPRPFGG